MSADRPVTRPSNFVSRHWHGEYPLWVSYWIFGFIVSVVSVLFLQIVEAAFSLEEYRPLTIFAALLTAWVGAGCIAVWQLVGVWRSASRYAEQRRSEQRSAFWGGCAKLAVVLGAIRLAGDLFGSALPQINEAYQIAFLNDPAIPAYALRVMRNGTEIEITGGFKYGLHNDLLKVLAASPQIRVIHLNSPGGRIGEATKLYHLIRKGGFVTYTSSSCASACTVAFAGGRQRWLSSNAKLGFHSGSFPGLREGGGWDINEAQRSAFLEAGFEPAFTTRAVSVSSRDIWQPTTDELVRAHVITGVVGDDKFAASGLGPHPTRAEMGSMLSRTLPQLRALADKEDVNADKIIDGFYTGYMKGETLSQLVNTARATLLPVMRSYIPLADDATLVDLARLLIKQYRSLNSQNPQACYEYASGIRGNKNYASYFSKPLIVEEMHVFQRIVETAEKRPILSDDAANSILEPIFVRLVGRYGVANVELMVRKNLPPSQYRNYCNVVVAMFEEILRLDHRTAASILRKNFQSF